MKKVILFAVLSLTAMATQAQTMVASETLSHSSQIITEKGVYEVRCEGGFGQRGQVAVLVYRLSSESGTEEFILSQMTYPTNHDCDFTQYVLNSASPENPVVLTLINETQFKVQR